MKLGAGGLVGAYTKSVTDALKKAEIVKYKPSVTFFVETDYACLKGLKREIASLSEVREYPTEFSGNVLLKFSVRTSEKRFPKPLWDLQKCPCRTKRRYVTKLSKKLSRPFGAALFFCLITKILTVISLFLTAFANLSVISAICFCRLLTKARARC